MSESLDGRLPSFGILDGGQATHLESLGFDLSSALWSAALLRSDDAKADDAIIQVHKDYLTSGAETIGTLTYQLSNKACAKAGWSVAEIRQVASLFEKATRLAHDAVTQTKRQDGSRGLVTLTLGPYGAALANGSEYTGDYAETEVRDSGSTGQPALEDLIEFHFERLRQAVSETAMSGNIDLIAFETIPRLDEAHAIVAALDRLAALFEATKKTLPPAYISFVFPPDAEAFLPFPAAHSQDRTGPNEVAQFMCKAQVESTWPITGVGINCTKPQMLKKAAEQMSRAMSQQPSNGQALSLFLYPDGGLVWDGINRRWLRPDGSFSDSEEQPQKVAAEWANELWSLAKTSAMTRCWTKIWLGGCCKTGPREIQELRKLSEHSPSGKSQ